jgi:hypothetical protein
MGVRITCHKCGQSGHKANNCPNEPEVPPPQPARPPGKPAAQGQGAPGLRPLETVTCFKASCCLFLSHLRSLSLCSFPSCFVLFTLSCSPGPFSSFLLSSLSFSLERLLADTFCQCGQLGHYANKCPNRGIPGLPRPKMAPQQYGQQGGYFPPQAFAPVGQGIPTIE